MSDDEIAERIAKHIRAMIDRGNVHDSAGMHIAVVNFMDDGEVFHLAHVEKVRDRAPERRRLKRVRARVFAALGLADRK